MGITTWSTLKADWLYSLLPKMEKLYTVRLGVDSGLDHECLIAKFTLKLKKVGKTTRSFRYDPYQIPYDYTVEVTNRFKGLDLIDRVPKELCGRRFITLYGRYWQKPSPRKRNAKRQNDTRSYKELKKKRSERQKRKGKIYLSECRVLEKSKDKKAFLSEQCKEIEENNRMGKTRDLFKKIRDNKRTFPL